MKTVVDNRTGVLLTVRDSYEVDLNSGECFPGWLEFSIPPNGKQAIRSGMFVEELLKWRCYQQIHVMCGKELLLVLPNDAFARNKGKGLLLAIAGAFVMSSLNLHAEVLCALDQECAFCCWGGITRRNADGAERFHSSLDVFSFSC